MVELTEVVVSIKDQLFEMLNSSAFTSDSAQGWIVMIILVVLVYKLSQNALDFVGWCIGVIAFIQICYWLGHTGLNNIIPFSNIFKYDILQSVAQCFVGTKICDWLLYADAFIRNICNMAWDGLSKLSIFKNTWETIKDSGGSFEWLIH